MDTSLQSREQSAVRAPGRAPGWSRRVYALLAWIFLLGVVAQVFFIGGALFGGGTLFGGMSWMGLHSMIGHMLVHPFPMIPLLLVILSLVGRLPASDRWLSGGLLFLSMLQPALIYIGRGQQLPLVAALHPVNALLMFVLPLMLVYRLRSHNHTVGVATK